MTLKPLHAHRPRTSVYDVLGPSEPGFASSTRSSRRSVIMMAISTVTPTRESMFQQAAKVVWQRTP